MTMSDEKGPSAETDFHYGIRKQNVMQIAGPLLLMLLFMTPMLGTHVFARYYVEPSAPIGDECKDPKSKPGSRAEVTWTTPAG